MIIDNYIEIMNKYGSENLPFLFIINFDASKGIVLQLDEIKNEDIIFKIDELTNEKDNYINKTIELKKKPESFEIYLAKFHKIKEHLQYGNTYLANLTCKSLIEPNCNLRDIYYSSSAKYKLYIKDQFVCFSPECFVNIINGDIFTYPMKGTISNDVPDALAKILSDEKEMQEHNTIVDLLRNDLSMVAEKVEVTKFRFPSYIKTKDYELIQISSEIKGKLNKNYQKKIGDIIAKLLPAGSVTGAPKNKTVEIIKEVEDYKRNFYTGIFGIYNNGNIRSAVSIRFIEKIEDNLFFKSGGGITINSDPKLEYQEMIDKIYVPIS